MATPAADTNQTPRETPRTTTLQDHPVQTNHTDRIDMAPLSGNQGIHQTTQIITTLTETTNKAVYKVIQATTTVATTGDTTPATINGPPNQNGTTMEYNQGRRFIHKYRHPRGNPKDDIKFEFVDNNRYDILKTLRGILRHFEDVPAGNRAAYPSRYSGGGERS